MVIIEINQEKNASCWSLLRNYITMRGPQNVKYTHKLSFILSFGRWVQCHPKFFLVDDSGFSVLTSGCLCGV